MNWIISILFLLSIAVADSRTVSFNNYKIGPYTSEMAFQDFSREMTKPNPSNAEIISIAPNNNVLRLRYPKGCLGTTKTNGCATQIHYKVPFARDTLWTAYKVFFEPGFDFRKGGKLPGLCGGKCYTGGKNPENGDGWSARIMWRVNGNIEQYVYHVGQKGKYGDSFFWNIANVQPHFQTGKWYYIVMNVSMNGLDINGNPLPNGHIRCWLNGKEALDVNNVIFRLIPTIRIDQLYISTFHGGNTSKWSPVVDSYTQFDDIQVSTDSISVMDLH